LNQVDQYFGQPVQIRGFESAVLAKPDGKGDRCQQSQEACRALLQPLSRADLNSNEIKVEKADNGIFRAIIPILGLNKHPGVVVLEYLSPAHPPQ
jgi:hypothetical protein